MNKPHIVILGAGYGGIMTAVKLQKQLGQNEAEITLVHKYDYHFQTSCLHENAAGTLHQDCSKIKIKDIINRSKINFIIDEVVSIKRETKKIRLKNRKLNYDLLVIGLGAEPNTKGIPGLNEYTYPITDINSARFIREHIEYNFASYANGIKKDESRLNIVIGGGGILGVAFAGELINQIPIMCKEYDVEKTQVHLYMLEESTTLLQGFDEELAHYAITSLQSRGVEVIHQAKLNECQDNKVIYEVEGKEYVIPSRTFIWTGGVEANPIFEKAGLTLKNKKIEVYSNMLSTKDDSIFVVGECAYTVNENGEEILPTAKKAVEEAAVVVKNISLWLRNKELTSCQPVKQGMLATLGRDDGVATIQNHKVFGWKAVLIKRISDNHYLYKLGGWNLLLKKGNFHLL
ncbi:NAD(P)/FAD-dependent oxidoreductase [Oceanobacillus neutriphilus]|uniref:NADH dehydrogenase-like protein YumB n=1 Tax=Oceanobacillus neutriphilus TaxID=531815 RepID=A0ABQ2NYS5_9BACI|nr:FAD-dependent oxidoreductase [Oceanobacillus neutriphilus]GGP13900.1 NADH dehydrogenase-like protein YumB [Oceanobacillus neutriphilus]